MKKLISILLCGILIISVLLTACGKDNNDEPDKATGESNPEESAGSDDVQVNPLDNIPVENFEGYEFKVLVKNDNGRWDNVLFSASEQTGEVINDMVYLRNVTIEDRYNIKITSISETNGNMANAIKKSVSAGDNAYDIVMPSMGPAGSLAAEGYLLNMFDVPNLDLSQSYWDQESVKGLSIANKLYYAAGDLMTLHHDATNICIFNKRLISEYNLESPYTLVKNNQWTLDKLDEMITGVTLDLNGDSILDRNDQFGYMTENPSALSLYYASGERLTSKNNEDLPEIALNSPSASDAVNKILAVMTNSATTIRVENLVAANIWEEAPIMFAEGKILFRTTSLRPVRDLREREMEDDYGILPLPKFTPEQDRYYHSVQIGAGNSDCVAIPSISSDPARTGLILQAICAASTDTIRQAYYDINLMNKLIRDDESAEMLDIIFSTRVYDLGIVYDWGTISSLLTDIVSNSTKQFASERERLQDRIELAINKTIGLITNLDH